MSELSAGLLSLEISTPTHSRTQQKHAKGQAEDCGQFSHFKIMERNVDVGMLFSQ